MDFREVKEFISDFSKYIIFIAIAILLFIYIISFMQVIGPSMSSTLSEGDLVFVSKLRYKISNPKRGDVIVFEHNGVKNLIKRVIGLPGDVVEYRNNKLYINNIEYKEDYLDKDMITDDFSTLDIGEKVIPEDKYLVLGDNRVNSQDSREIGYVSKDDIIGKVIWRFWPVNKVKKF